MRLRIASLPRPHLWDYIGYVVVCCYIFGQSMANSSFGLVNNIDLNKSELEGESSRGNIFSCYDH